MSLTSLFTNLFSPSSSKTPDHRAADDGRWTVKAGTGVLGAENMAQETDEEEGRPPYLHVRLFLAPNCFSFPLGAEADGNSQ